MDGVGCLSDEQVTKSPGTFPNMLPWQAHLTQNNTNSISLEGQAHFVTEQDTRHIFRLWRPVNGIYFIPNINRYIERTLQSLQ